MTKFEKVWWYCVIVASLGIIGFWVGAWYDNMKVAEWSIGFAGTSAWIGLISYGLGKLRYRNGCF